MCKVLHNSQDENSGCEKISFFHKSQLFSQKSAAVTPFTVCLVAIIVRDTQRHTEFLFMPGPSWTLVNKYLKPLAYQRRGDTSSIAVGNDGNVLGSGWVDVLLPHIQSMTFRGLTALKDNHK